MTTIAAAQQASPPVAPPEGAPSEDVEAVARGPLHEAFAEVHVEDPEPGVRVEREPPEPIEEVPPEHKPEGEDVEWIPGYWAWDVDREDFLWVSGVWRKVPPGRSWVPGYWSEAEDSWRWVSGFWADAEAGKLEYLPSPPESVETGPSSPAPSENFSYVPGNWEYTGDEYRWRTGYWHPVREDLVWIPGRYIWTPRGCIYRPGYWDFLPHRRGTLFAPVYFHKTVYLQPTYCFTPYYVIDVGPSFLIHLFVRPAYCHYYFGDYYGDHYRQYDIFPWVHVWGHHHRYDPLYALYSQCSRHHTTLSRVRGWHSYFHRHKDRRPLHTFAAARRAHGHEGDIGRMARLGGAYDELVRRADGRHDFVRVERGPRREFRNRSARFREFSRLRAALEVSETETHSSGDRPEGVADKISQLLQQQRSQWGRQNKAIPARPRPDSDRQRFQNRADGERARAKLGDHRWRSGETPRRAQRGVQADTGSAAARRKSMAEFLHQQRARLSRQLENTWTQPQPASGLRKPDTRANERSGRAALDHSSRRAGPMASRPRITPRLNTPTSASNSNAMTEFLKQQRARIERQAARAASRPSPASRSAQRPAPPSTPSSSRLRQPPAQDATRSGNGRKSGLRELLGKRRGHSGSRAESGRSLPGAGRGGPPALRRDSSRAAAAHAKRSRPPTSHARSGRPSRGASAEARAGRRHEATKSASRAAKRLLGHGTLRSRKREKKD